MPLSSAVRAKCRKLVGTGEIRYLFPATALAMGGATAAMAPMIVVVTDREVVLILCSRWRKHKPREVTRRYPRAIHIGPVDTSMTPEFQIGELWFETDEEYVAVIRAADAEISSIDYLPPDPLPDL